MKLLQVLRLIRQFLPDDLKDVIDRVIIYMEVVDRVLDLILDVLPQNDESPVPTASHPKVVELRSLLAKLEEHR